jgi:hypothetical protein
MAQLPFLADSSFPGLSAPEVKRYASALSDGLLSLTGGSDLRRGFRGADSRTLRDLGLDRGAC